MAVRRRSITATISLPVTSTEFELKKQLPSPESLVGMSLDIKREERMSTTLSCFQVVE